MSVSVTINFINTTKKKYVVFKPLINFISTNKKIIEDTKEFFGLNQKIYIIKYEQRVRYELRVQNFDNIQVIIDKIKKEDLKIKTNFVLFVEIFRLLRDNGHVQKEYQEDLFKEIIDKKMLLNKDTRTRKSMTTKMWLKKIKEHLF